MKKLLHTALIIYFTALLTFVITSCRPESSDSGGSENKTTVSTPPPTTTPPTVTGTDDPVEEPTGPEEEPTETEPDPMEVKFAVKISDKLYFTDGEKLKLWKQGDILKAGSRKFTHEADIITLDANGSELSTETLPETPKAIKDNFFCKEYSQQESLDLGAQYKIHSEIYKNNAVISAWYLNQWECKSIVSADGKYFAVDQNGAYHGLDNTIENINHVNDGYFYMHSLDTSTKRLWFNTSMENYGLNYAFNTDQWIGKFSERGYTWTVETGLQENETALQAWNESPYPVTPALPFGENPVLLKVGEYDGKLFWIECNSGWLFEYVPETDTLTQTYRLYGGDGTRIIGLLKRDELKPLIVEGILYYSDSGSIYKVSTESGIINIFYAGSGEVVKYE